MRVLLIGSGGREHALAWAMKRSPRLDRLFVAPGNGGTAAIAENEGCVRKSTEAIRENGGAVAKSSQAIRENAAEYNAHIAEYLNLTRRGNRAAADTALAATTSVHDPSLQVTAKPPDPEQSATSNSPLTGVPP